MLESKISTKSSSAKIENLEVDIQYDTSCQCRLLGHSIISSSKYQKLVSIELLGKPRSHKEVKNKYVHKGNMPMSDTTHTLHKCGD